jgi:hypothetical protein
MGCIDSVAFKHNSINTTVEGKTWDTTGTHWRLFSYKETINVHHHNKFPSDPYDALWSKIKSVFLFLKIGAAGCSKTLVTICQITRSHTIRDINPRSRCCGISNLTKKMYFKSHTLGRHTTNNRGKSNVHGTLIIRYVYSIYITTDNM